MFLKQTLILSYVYIYFSTIKRIFPRSRLRLRQNCNVLEYLRNFIYLISRNEAWRNLELSIIISCCRAFDRRFRARAILPIEGCVGIGESMERNSGSRVLNPYKYPMVRTAFPFERCNHRERGVPRTKFLSPRQTPFQTRLLASSRILLFFSGGKEKTQAHFVTQLENNCARLYVYNSF